jgi:hypothetical protein
LQKRRVFRRSAKPIGVIEGTGAIDLGCTVNEMLAKRAPTIGWTFCKIALWPSTSGGCILSAAIASRARKPRAAVAYECLGYRIL